MLDYSGALEDISQALALAPNYSEVYTLDLILFWFCRVLLGKLMLILFLWLYLPALHMPRGCLRSKRSIWSCREVILDMSRDRSFSSQIETIQGLFCFHVIFST